MLLVLDVTHVGSVHRANEAARRGLNTGAAPVPVLPFEKLVAHGSVLIVPFLPLERTNSNIPQK